MSEGEKHTPAPWFVANLTLPEFADPKVKVLCIADSDGEIICQLYTNLEGGTFDHYERDEANARVIAAAPKLLLALQHIEQWSHAYPLAVFPEPDLVKAAELLKAGGITLDAVSASCMRHVVEGVGKIAREVIDEAIHGVKS